MQSRFSRITFVLVLMVVVIGGGVFFFLKTHHKPIPIPVVEVLKVVSPVYAVIGKSVEGRNIESYTYGTGTQQLVFVGGMHGGYEWNSVMLAYDFMDYLNKDPSVIPSNIKITVIPELNVDAVVEVVGKTGPFTVADVSTSTKVQVVARFNADNVDLNRNFDCKWQPKSTWQNKTVSAGTSAFSEPEAQAIKKIADEQHPAAFIFWHSQANAVYASECKNGILPDTLGIMNAYAKAAGYPAVKSFDAYPVTGDSEGWLASQNIPAITVELKTHNTIEWDKNLAGIKALFEYYRTK